MRVVSLLMAALFSALLILGLQLMSPAGKAFDVTATVDIKPDTLNLNLKGRWITAYIEPSTGYSVSDIDPEPKTILLEGLFAAEWSNIEDGRLMVKFNFDSNTELINYLREQLYHMQPGGWRAPIELRVTGQLVDGTQFSVSDTITIMDPIGK